MQVRGSTVHAHVFALVPVLFSVIVHIFLFPSGSLSLYLPLPSLEMQRSNADKNLVPRPLSTRSHLVTFCTSNSVLQGLELIFLLSICKPDWSAQPCYKCPSQVCL